MIRSTFVAAVAVAVGAWAFDAAAQAQDKDVKVTGTLVCGKCKLKETAKCTNVLQVKDGDKVVKYFLADKGNGEEYHEGVCGGEKAGRDRDRHDDREGRQEDDQADQGRVAEEVTASSRSGASLRGAPDCFSRSRNAPAPEFHRPAGDGRRAKPTSAARQNPAPV